MHYTTATFCVATVRGKDCFMRMSSASTSSSLSPSALACLTPILAACILTSSMEYILVILFERTTSPSTTPDAARSGNVICASVGFCGLLSVPVLASYTDNPAKSLPLLGLISLSTALVMSQLYLMYMGMSHLRLLSVMIEAFSADMAS